MPRQTNQSTARRSGISLPGVAVLSLMLLILAGCSGSEPAASSATSASSNLAAPSATGHSNSADATTESPATNTPDAVVVDYATFWSVSRSAGQAAESEWRTKLEAVAVDPMLTQLLEGFRIQRSNGIVLYGEVVAHVTDVQIAGVTAKVTDCQDASNAGQADAATGDVKTVGVARNPVTADMSIGADGHWRVQRIDYPGGTC